MTDSLREIAERMVNRWACQEFDSTAILLERAMRRAIEATWKRQNYVPVHRETAFAEIAELLKAEVRKLSGKEVSN